MKRFAVEYRKSDWSKDVSRATVIAGSLSSAVDYAKTRLVGRGYSGRVVAVSEQEDDVKIAK